MKVLEKGNPSTVQCRPGAVRPGACSVFTARSLSTATFLWILMLWLPKAPLHILFFPTSPGLSCPAFPSWDSPFPNVPNQRRGHPAAPPSVSHSSLVTVSAHTTGLPHHLALAHASSSVFYWECLLLVQVPPLPVYPHVTLPNTGNIWASYINVKTLPFTNLFLRATVTSFQSQLSVS